jgi:DNA polymerase III delta prime subunit
MTCKVLIGQMDQIVQAATKILEENSLKIGHPDVLWVNDQKLGVEQAKQIRIFLSLKPYSAQGRAIVVLQADNLTLDSQNALLKTLEEPPLEAIILLGAQNDKKILPTVLSRCQVVTLDRVQDTGNRGQENKKESEPFNEDIEKLIKSSPEERFEYVEKLEDKEAFLNALVAYFHQQLTTNNSQPTTDFAKELLHAEEWQEANGNIRAILEYLMLKMPSL